MCSLVLRSAARASRIYGCGSAEVAVAGAAGRAFPAGVAGTLALLGAAGAVAMNANARIKDARPSRLTILVFMNHSSRPNIGSDRRIVPLLSIRKYRYRGAHKTSELLSDLNTLLLGHLARSEQRFFVT